VYDSIERNKFNKLNSKTIITARSNLSSIFFAISKKSPGRKKGERRSKGKFIKICQNTSSAGGMNGLPSPPMVGSIRLGGEGRSEGEIIVSSPLSEPEALPPGQKPLWGGA